MQDTRVAGLRKQIRPRAHFTAVAMSDADLARSIYFVA